MMKALMLVFALVLFLGCTQTESGEVMTGQGSSPVVIGGEPGAEPAEQPEETTEPEEVEEIVEPEEIPEEEPEEVPEEEPEEFDELPEPVFFDLEPENISFKSFGWVIKGDVYGDLKNEPTKAIILLPMLSKTRESYSQSLIKRLHDDVSDSIIVTLDLRGHGESTNLGTYEDFTDFDYRDMKSDVINAMKYISEEYLTVNEFYLVGASIGSTAAITAAEQSSDYNVYKIAMLSPGMEYRNIDITDAVDHYNKKLFLAAGEQDIYSYDSVEEIHSMSSAKVTKITYDTNAHGTDLFEATKYDNKPLIDQLTLFLKND